MNRQIKSRLAAACIAVTTWTGIVVQLIAVYSQNSSVLLTLWIVLGYFTIITNLLVAVIFTGYALGISMFRPNWVVSGTMLSILLVGVVYGLLLHGTVELSGGSAIANVILHMITPVLVPLFWIFLVRKGGLTFRNLLLWACYPLLYFVYGLMRGAATGRYAYPFLNLPALGWGQTLLNAALIAGGFMLSGAGVLWLDRRLSARSRIAT